MAVLSGLIAAAGAIGGAAIASGGAKSAAKTAAASADQASQVQREIYGENKALLSPFVQQGLPATAAINSLLGLTPTMPAQSYGTPQATYQPAQNYGYSQPNALAQFVPGHSVEDYSYLSPNAMGDMSSNGGGWLQAGGYAPMQQQQTAPTAGTVGTTVNPQSGFDTFRNSTGYQFRLNEGLKAVNGGFAGRGLLQSGAALKSLNDYGQGMASAEFGNYLNALGNQQAMGLSAAQATAGVGSGYANSLGSIAMMNGQNQAAAAAAKSQAMGGMVNSLGQIGAGILGQSGGRGGYGITAPPIVQSSGGLQPLSGGWSNW